MTIIYSLGTTDPEVSRIKSLFGDGICKDYLEFMKEKNGLFLYRDSFCEIPFEQVDDKFISFLGLYGISPENECLDIEVVNDKFSDEIEFIEKPIIIGSDPGGNFFILSSRGDDCNVYYWDRAHIHFEGNYDFAEVNEEGNVYILANSFNEFLSLIEKNIEGNKEIKTMPLSML